MSSALVASQVGLAMVVVISSGLLLRSLWVLQRMDVGFETERLVALSLTINDARYPERAEYLAAYSRLIDRLADVPGVESVGSIRFLPLRRDGEVTDLEVRDAPSGDEPSARVRVLQVSPGFLGTAGVPLLAGRDFTVADREDGPRVVIVNDALRRRHFPGVSPVGRSVTLGGAVTAEVVGVVGDVRQRSLADEAEPTVYVPQAQLPRRGMAFLLRAEGDPAPLLPLVRAAVADVDPDQPIESLALMRDVVATSTAQPRFFSLLLAGFGLLSLFLAALGIYGVVAHAVSRRVSEIGIRVALGAPRAGLLGLVISGGMRPVLVGALAGLAVATLTTRLLASVLYGVRALDPVTFLAVPLLLLATGLLACWLPARRAVGIDPARALRAE